MRAVLSCAGEKSLNFQAQRTSAASPKRWKQITVSKHTGKQGLFLHTFLSALRTSSLGGGSHIALWILPITFDKKRTNFRKRERKHPWNNLISLGWLHDDAQARGAGELRDTVSALGRMAPSTLSITGNIGPSETIPFDFQRQLLFDVHVSITFDEIKCLKFSVRWDIPKVLRTTVSCFYQIFTFPIIPQVLSWLLPKGRKKEICDFWRHFFCISSTAFSPMEGLILSSF